MRFNLVPSCIVAIPLLWSAGCCSTHDNVGVPPYVSVREAQFRSEDSKADRITLPLNSNGRERLLKFLQSGGNTSLVGKGRVMPESDKRYADLLQFLSQPHQDSDVTSNKDKYFSVGPFYEVIDAREALPLSDTQVVAMGDGYYWWIFYHPISKRLEGLLVTRAVGGKPPEN